MPAPFAHLRDELAVLDPAVPAAGEAVDAYRDFYHLDAGDTLPGVCHAMGTLESRGRRLVAQCWTHAAARGQLLIVHGLFDHVGLFPHLLRYGLTRGYNVVAFDLPGHGLSEGEPSVIDDFADYSAAIADVVAAIDLPGDWDVVAQSTGGAAVMDLLTRHEDPFRHVALLAPLVRPHGWWWIRLAHSVLRHWRDSVTRGYGENSHDREFLAFVRDDPLPARVVPVRWIGALRRWLEDFVERQGVSRPLLVVQGEEDLTVDWRYNMGVVARLFPAARIEYLAEGRHHLPNESAPIREQVMRLLDTALERSPAERGPADRGPA